MAQDNLDALTDAVMQAESRGRRFGSDAKKLLESVKGAQGEMQVMPKTQMKPGYGVEPAKDKSGDEIARVGRDYLKAMVGKYGDQVHALAAYNWGPGNTDKWVAAGADMSKLPAETRKYIQEVQSNLQSRLAKQEPGKPAEPTEAEKIMEPALRSGMSAQAPTQTPARAQTVLAQLGPNYQAALALNTIAEQDEKDAEDEGDKLDDWQRDKEMEAEIEGGTAKRALAALEGLSFQSPVAGEQQPVRMAAGGAIQLTPIAALNPAKKAELGAAKSEWDKYNTNATAYNDALTKYKAEKYDPYVNAVNKYNTTLQIYGSLPATSSLLPPIPAVPEEFKMVAPEQPKVEAAKVQAMAKAAAQDRNSRQAALDAAGNPEAYGLTINRIGFADGGEADKDSKKFPEMESKSDVDFIRSAHKMQMGDKELQNALLGLGMDGAMVGATLSNMKQGDKEQLARSLMASYNTRIGDVGVNASVMRPMNSSEEPEMYMGNVGASVPVGQGRLMLNAMGMQTPQESRSTGHSIGYERQIGPGTFSASMMQPRDNPDGRSYQLQYRMPVGRADGSPMGGENADHMTPQEIERMAAAQRPAFMTPGSGRGRTAGPISQALKSGEAYIAAAKGVTELPYDIAGAPVDLATMAMRPFGYSTEKPVMGSDWIKEKMTALNVRPEPPADPTLKGFYTMGELGSNLVNPAAVARKAGPIVEQGAKALGKETARQVLRGIEGEGMLAPISPPMAFAVKPRGGTFATSGSVDAPFISEMDEILEVYRNALKKKFPADQHDVVDLLVDKKMRKYFTNEYGTANDPLRTAMRSGEFPVHGTDVENFPEYLLAAARNPNAEGHAQAKRHLEKFYDERTGINLKALGLGSSSDADARSRFNTSVRDFERKQREAMTAEGLPAEFQNTPYIDKYTLEDTRTYPNSTEVLRNMVAAGKEGRLPSGQVWALKNEQPIYDISNPRFEFLDPKVLAETIQSLDPKKLKNMSFEQAVIEGTKNMQVFREYDTAVERAARGLSVPKEVVSMFTKPVLKTDAGEWVQLTNPAATKLEGKLLHHSIGGYADNPNYNLGGPEAFRSGKAQVFSLRQEKTALPEITIEAEKTKDGLKITQIKGNYNSFPSHRAEDVFKFMEKHPDIVHINSDYYPKNNVGAELEQKIGVDWQTSYDHWKSGLPGDWVVTRESPTRIDYVYGIPKKAQGGMMERNKGDNRRYL